MVARNACRYCKRDYRNVDGIINIYKNSHGKWCSTCSCCGIEQAYTRKDHAKQSELADWQCKACIAKQKGFSNNQAIGNKRRLYNRFRKSANTRRIAWEINYEQFIKCFTGKCALSGWNISMDAKNCTASFDRIDSKKPYELNNVQWVHIMVNMCKNKYNQGTFIEMCTAIANQNKVVKSL